MKPKDCQEGMRVGAISHSKQDVVFVFGFGEYAGRHVPPRGTRGPFGVDAHVMGPNPKIVLDSGEVVWGCQCWWGSERDVKKRLEAFEEVKTVPVPEPMSQEELDELDDEASEA